MRTSDIIPDGPVPEGPAPEPESAAPRHIRTGRNLPVAIGVGVILGGLALLTLLTVKATFLIYMGAALAIGLHELSAALKTKDVNVPLLIQAFAAEVVEAIGHEGVRDALMDAIAGWLEQRG